MSNVSGYFGRKQPLDKPASIRIADADRDCFFPSGLEYNPPARGMWNIVHQGMLVPGAHQIFVCAQGCLRGVILTAAEMGALGRMSWISVSEEDMFDGTLESDVVDGVKELIPRLDSRPPVVLLFLSCIHFFAGVDFEEIIRELNEAFPDITFVDCYMTPTMRKTVSPVAKMSAQLYGALKPLPLKKNVVGIVGNDRPTGSECELFWILEEAGFEVRDITACKSYEEYLSLAECAYNITHIPTGYLAGEELERRFGAKHLHLPVRFDFDGIEENYRVLCETLGIAVPDLTTEREYADKAMRTLRDRIGRIPVAIDYTMTTRPFELALLMTKYDMNVQHIIADTCAGEEEAFDRLRELVPDLRIYSAANVNMLDMPEEEHGRILALGQKAAFYFQTKHFVEYVVNGGFYGYDGVIDTARSILDAYCEEKDIKNTIKLKGYGCSSCLLY